VPAPKVGTDATAATAAARAPDGSLIVVGYSHNRPSEDSPVHGIQQDIWVTRVLPD
jgi:hypothetical protein